MRAPETDEILDRVRAYYEEKLAEHGPVARGVDWNSAESQTVRFRQLLRVVDDGDGELTLNDFGCGYGALVEELDRLGRPFRYRGFDLSERMLVEARRRFGDRADCAFVSDPEALEPADYTVASGVLNVKMDVPEEEWKVYVTGVVHRLAALSTRGFAFNVLTGYADEDKKRDRLYYADPCRLFDYCKRTFSRHVALLHDYELWEFTLIVRAEEGRSWRAS